MYIYILYMCVCCMHVLKYRYTDTTMYMFKKYSLCMYAMHHVSYIYYIWCMYIYIDTIFDLVI